MKKSAAIFLVFLGTLLLSACASSDDDGGGGGGFPDARNTDGAGNFPDSRPGADARPISDARLFPDGTSFGDGGFDFGDGGFMTCMSNTDCPAADDCCLTAFGPDLQFCVPGMEDPVFGCCPDGIC